MEGCFRPYETGERSYVNGSYTLPDFNQNYLGQPVASAGERNAGPAPPDIPLPANTAPSTSPAPAAAQEETSYTKDRVTSASLPSLPEYEQGTNDTSLNHMTRGDTGEESHQSATIITDATAVQAPPPPKRRTRLGVRDLIIDHNGVSGLFFGTDVIQMGDVDVDNKWDFSVNTLALELVTSNVVGFGFGGYMAIPINKKGKEFSYVASANIPTRTYNFKLTAEEDLDFPIFKLAQVGIDSSSYIDITSTPDKRFQGTAVLHGYAAVKGKRR